jgi:hypothetical protein
VIQPGPPQLYCCLSFGLSALAAGYSFIDDPTGIGIGMTVTYLRHSPFSDFLIPGLVLFLFNGIGAIAAALLAFSRTKRYPRLVFAQGIVLVWWIIIQTIMVRDFNLLHLGCLVSGIALIILSKKMS